MPGPGTYNVGVAGSQTGGRSRRWLSHAGKLRSFIRDNNADNSNSQSVNKRLGRFQAIYEPTPGPGDYQAYEPRKRSPRALFGKSRRNSSLVLNNNPGPGAYEASAGKQPGWTFHTAVRGRDPTTTGPGPGDYTTHSSIGFKQLPRGWF